MLSSFVGNSAAMDGGGLLKVGGLSISGTVFAHNQAGQRVGGIRAFADFHAGSLQLNDVFVIQNTAGSQGGGIFNEADLLLTHVTIADNHPNDCVQINGQGCP